MAFKYRGYFIVNTGSEYRFYAVGHSNAWPLSPHCPTMEAAKKAIDHKYKEAIRGRA